MKLLVVVLSGLVMTGASALGAETPETPAGYTRTGQFETCLAAHRIRETQILNSSQILFKMIGGETYLNEPKGGCPSMNKSLALVYNATPDQLCNTTIVHLADFSSPVSNRGTCNIAKFEKLTKAPKAP